MVRVFGLLIAALALMAPANAALLVYNFDDANGNVSGAPAGSTATPFGGTGGLQAGPPSHWSTGTLNAPAVNTFSFTAGGSALALDKLTLVSRRGSSAPLDLANVVVTYSVNGGPILNLASFVPNDTYNPTVTNPIGVDLLIGQTITFTITSSMAVGTPTDVRFDSISLSGVEVPEPASMAIFGLMGAGLAVRRFRRK